MIEWPELKQRVITAEKKIEDLQAKVDYARDFGLIVGIVKSSDCPRGRLAHDTKEGSDLQRLERGIANLIDAESKIEQLKHDKTTAFAVERDAYRREVEKWKAICVNAEEELKKLRAIRDLVALLTRYKGDKLQFIGHPKFHRTLHTACRFKGALPKGLVADTLQEALTAFELQHDIIINILTDSQLDTRGECGKTIREYLRAAEILLRKEG